MALPPPRGHWDVTYLATKYPWLRVDQQALEEFRSPFRWVSDVSPRSPSSDDANEGQSRAKPQHLRKRGTRASSREEGTIRGKRGQRKLKNKSRAKLSLILRNHAKIFSNTSSGDESKRNNSPGSEETMIPLLNISTRPGPTLMPLVSIPALTIQSEQDRFEDSEAVLGNLQQDHELLVQLRKHKRKQRKRKKPTNLLAFSFPVISPKPAASVPRGSKLDSIKVQTVSTPRTLMDKYSQQMKELADEEQRLEETLWPALPSRRLVYR